MSGSRSTRFSAEYSTERSKRINRTWASFCQAMWQQCRRRVPEQRSEQARLRLMREALNRGQPPEWVFESVLAACDIGADVEECRLPARPCEPTAAKPGTREKVLVMAARVATGREVFHVSDA